MDAATVVLALLVMGYIALYMHVRRSPSLQERGLVPYGPAMLLKTQRGIGIMDRLGRYKRFWAAYALLSKFIVLGLMLFITGLVLYQLTIIPSIPRESALGFEYILALPGINPIIPVVYGIVALIVCLFIHEVAHGVLTRANDMDVESTGLLFFIVPVGAFVEPSSEQIQSASKKKRTSVYAVGAATNFIFAIIFLLLLNGMTGSLESPYGEQPMLVSVTPGSPAEIAGLAPGMVITGVGGLPLDGMEGFLSVPFTPGSPVSLEYVQKGGSGSLQYVSGVHVESVLGGSPAESAGLGKGMIIKSIDGVDVPNQRDFNAVMDATLPGQTIAVEALARNAVSGDWEPVAGIGDLVLTTGSAEKGYMGITTTYAGMGVLIPDVLLSLVSDPYSGTESASDLVFDTLRFLALPFSGLSPLPSELTWVYESSLMGEEAFWFLANTAYWVFWMNFMVATTNCLPAVPLDGGFILMDWLDSLVSRLKRGASEEQRRRIVSTVINWLTLVILFSVLFMFIGPRLF